MLGDVGADRGADGKLGREEKRRRRGRGRGESCRGNLKLTIAILFSVVLATGRFTGEAYDAPNKLEPPGFAHDLFENDVSQAIREAVLKTEFFQGMVKNDLSPTHFGGYMVQDGAFCYGLVEAFETAASKAQSPAFAQYYKQMASTYKGINAFYFKRSLHLQSADGVFLSPAAAKFVGFELNLASSDHQYLSIGTLAGRMLWPWVATQINDAVPAGGLYRPWVDFYLPPSHMTPSAIDFANRQAAAFDKAKSQDIFNEAMLHELNFFLSACGEEQVTLEHFLS